MAIIKCKMCGGELILTEGSTVAECEYCGTLQTVPTADDEKMLTMFARANKLRAGCEFDKAAGIYESIAAEFPDEAEAYWGLILCKYGIEYVDDPATGKKIPTCHRSSFDSVLEDEVFERVLECSDLTSRRVYRDEAKFIEELRKRIIEVSGKEAPYDIFICYKETDEAGNRTVDSVMAEEIYNKLTAEGYRVFFSRITLEDKLGQEYEPYIFAALNSAKIMLAFGTDYEYYNAVWVKNEWSRFLKLMEKDKSKYLIPCFKGIDAYDMPKEFARLQAQDMGKVGADQDLLRGIRKLLPKQEATAAPAPAPVVVQQAAASTAAPLLKRAFLFLEDGKWEDARAYCEKVLDQDPENAQAYLGKLMAFAKVHRQEDLKNAAQPFGGRVPGSKLSASNDDYQKVLRFGDDALKATVKGYNDTIIERLYTEIYSKADAAAKKAGNESAFNEAAQIFRTISEYKDAGKRAEECTEKAEECRKNMIYSSAAGDMSKKTVKGYQSAIASLKQIRGWKDADEKIIECERAIEEIVAEEKRQKEEREAEEKRQREEREAEKKRRLAEAEAAAARRREKAEEEQKRIRERKEQQKKKTRIISLIVIAAVAACAVLALLMSKVIIPNANLSKLNEQIAAKDYTAAIETLQKLDGRVDTEEYREAFVALKNGLAEQAAALADSGDAAQAAILYRRAGETQKADAVFDIPSRVFTDAYASAAIQADGSLIYRCTLELYDSKPDEDLKGITAFFETREGGASGVDAQGRLLSHVRKYRNFLENRDVASKLRNYQGIVDGLYEDTDDIAVLLLDDGTLVQASKSGKTNFPDLAKWTNIADISPNGKYLTYITGIDKDGNLFIAENIEDKQKNSIAGKTASDVKKAATTSEDVVCLKNDGTVEYIGYNEKLAEKLAEKKNVADICRSEFHDTILLYDNGTVERITLSDDCTAQQQIDSELAELKQVVSLQFGAGGVFCYQIDGTVEYVSLTTHATNAGRVYDRNTDFDAEVSTWTNVVYVSAPEIDADGEWIYAVAIMEDGTADSTGTGVYYSYEKRKFSFSSYDYYYESHPDGQYCNVADWKLW